METLAFQAGEGKGYARLFAGEHTECRAMIGKLLKAIDFIAGLTEPQRNAGLYDTDIYAQCQELLAIESARECREEWEILWTIAFHAENLLMPGILAPFINTEEEMESLREHVKRWAVLNQRQAYQEPQKATERERVASNSAGAEEPRIFPGL